EQPGPAGCVPDHCRLVLRGGGQALTIGAVRHRGDVGGVALEGQEILAVGCVPGRRGLVSRGGGPAAPARARRRRAGGRGRGRAGRSVAEVSASAWPLRVRGFLPVAVSQTTAT